jgi:HupE / UreJ protein
MRSKITASIVAYILLTVQPAFAHRIDEYLQATIVSLEKDSIHASMRLIPGVLVSSVVIDFIDTNGVSIISGGEQRAYAQRVIADVSITIDGKIARPKLVACSFPQPSEMREGLGEIHIDYTVDLPKAGTDRSLVLANHHLSRRSVYLMNVIVPQDRNTRILAQKRNEQQSVYELDLEQGNLASAAPQRRWDRIRVWFNGLSFISLFCLGMHHIAEGTDHLLFLLALLLPAPLTVAGVRWGPAAGIRQSLLRIAGIVTAFTIGHSTTLSLAALGFVHVPDRPVEALIAVSILVSALHALRPIFPGREAWIAAFFGLIHGLAFAATLGRLGLETWERLAGVFAFNLGIETMQIIVVAVTLPSLMFLSRTSAYPSLRIGGPCLPELRHLCGFSNVF